MAPTGVEEVDDVLEFDCPDEADVVEEPEFADWLDFDDPGNDVLAVLELFANRVGVESLTGPLLDSGAGRVLPVTVVVRTRVCVLWAWEGIVEEALASGQVVPPRAPSRYC